MHIGLVLLILALLLLLGLLLQPLGERIRLPLAALLVASGFAGSQVIGLLGYGNAIDDHIFQELIVYAFLPVLVFSASFQIDARLLRDNLLPILLLAIPGLLGSVAIVALLVYYGIASPEGFPWIAALITGVVVSATDASPLTSQFARSGVPKRLRVLLEGEGLLNDAVAIVAFGILIYIALHPTEDITLVDILIRFVVVFFGGILVGLLTDIGFLLLSRLFDDHLYQGVVTLVSAYTAYLLARDVLNVSGIMAVLVIGLIMGRVIHEDFQDERGSFVDQFWQFNAFVVEALMFVLMGMMMGTDMFTERWLAILIGIIALIIGRAANIMGSSLLLRKTAHPLAGAAQRILMAGSLRGAVVLALALSVPADLSYWWTIQSIAFGVVVFSLFVQAPLALRSLDRKQQLTSRDE